MSRKDIVEKIPYDSPEILNFGAMIMIAESWDDIESSSSWTWVVFAELLGHGGSVLIFKGTQDWVEGAVTQNGTTLHSHFAVDNPPRPSCCRTTLQDNSTWYMLSSTVNILLLFLLTKMETMSKKLWRITFILRWQLSCSELSRDKMATMRWLCRLGHGRMAGVRWPWRVGLDPNCNRRCSESKVTEKMGWERILRVI